MIADAITLWNETAAACGWPRVRGLTADRERKLKRLIRNGLDDWKEALAMAQQSDFLCGRVERRGEHANWRLSFDTFIRESFFIRVLEGTYNAPDAPVTTFRPPEESQWEARLRTYKPGGFWPWGKRPEEGGCQAPKALVEEWKTRHMAAH